MRRFQRLLTAALTLGMVSAASAQTTTSKQDFIKGVDISTLQALEDKGIKFYDGGKERDLLAILKARGVNYVRLRVWNNPVEAEGYNDKAKLLELAPRVKAAGLKLLVDFHGSGREARDFSRVRDSPSWTERHPYGACPQPPAGRGAEAEVEAPCSFKDIELFSFL